MWNDSDKREDGNDDLSEMINAYSQDNELRRKINELKKQKEEEQNKPEQQPTFHNFMDEEIHPLPTGKAGGIPDIRVDDTMSNTRVGYDGDNAYDKTLVIMNSKSKSSFQEDATYEEEPQESMMDDDAGKTMITDFRTLKDADTLVQNNYEDEEEYEEDDDEEEEEKPRKRKGGNSDSDDGTKMNKIITYVIIGIVALLILVAGGFGVKYALDNWLSSDTPADVDSKDEGKDTGSTTTDKNPPKDEKDEETEKPNIDDNSAEKAKVQGELASLEQQLEAKKVEVTTATQAVSDAKTNRDTYATQLSTLTNEVSAAKLELEAAQSVTKLAQAKLNNAKETDDKVALQASLDAAKKDEAAKQKTFDEKNTQLTNENNRYETMMKSLNEAVTTAEATLKQLKEEQTKLETSVANKTTELNKYN